MQAPSLLMARTMGVVNYLGLHSLKVQAESPPLFLMHALRLGRLQCPTLETGANAKPSGGLGKNTSTEPFLTFVEGQTSSKS